MEKEQQQDTGYLDMIQKLITEIKFGTVTIIVQAGKVIQIEKNEKYRMKSKD